MRRTINVRKSVLRRNVLSLHLQTHFHTQSPLSVHGHFPTLGAHSSSSLDILGSQALAPIRSLSFRGSSSALLLSYFLCTLYTFSPPMYTVHPLTSYVHCTCLSAYVHCTCHTAYVHCTSSQPMCIVHVTQPMYIVHVTQPMYTIHPLTAFLGRTACTELVSSSEHGRGPNREPCSGCP